MKILALLSTLCITFPTLLSQQDPFLSQPNTTTLQAYESRIQEYTDSTPQTVSGPIKEWIDRSLTYIKKGGTILELGCGTGRDAKYIELQGYKVKRTDAAASFIELLKTQGQEAYILNALTDDLGGPYAMIFANGVFLHFTPEETKKVFTKIHRSLQPDGILAFTVKYGEGSEWSKDKLDMPRYYCYWKEDTLKELLNQTGFEIVELATLTNSHSNNPTWLHVIARKAKV